jgi:hypothetical protein
MLECILCKGMATGGPNIIEVEVVLVSSGEPSDLGEVAQSSRTEGPVALA